MFVVARASSETCRILIVGALNVQSLCNVMVVIVVSTTNIPDQNPPHLESRLVEFDDLVV